MAASYPLSVKVFTPKTDLQDINFAEDINEIYDEVEAIEQTFGINPYLNLPYASLNAALTDLYLNKAPATHTHVHSTLSGDANGNDHPQYALLSGCTFTGPVKAPPGWLGQHCATYGQLQALGIADVESVQAEIDAQLANRCSGAASGSAPLVGNPTTFGWNLIGGYNEGCTDTNGLVACEFGSGITEVVQAFVATKAITGLGSTSLPASYFPCPVYNPATTDLTLHSIDVTQAVVQFTVHATGAPLSQQHVAWSWHLIGF